jgi:hypothetical protein
MSMKNLWATKCKKGKEKIKYEWFVYTTYNVLMWNTYDLHFN